MATYYAVFEKASGALTHMGPVALLAVGEEGSTGEYPAHMEQVAFECDAEPDPKGWDPVTRQYFPDLVPPAPAG